MLVNRNKIYFLYTSPNLLDFRIFLLFLLFFKLNFWFISCSMLLGWSGMYHKKRRTHVP